MATSPSIAILTPTKSGLFSTDYVRGLTAVTHALSRMGIPWGWIETHDGPISMALDRLAHRFLGTEFSHAFWLDADVGIQAGVVTRMLARGEDFVCVPYLQRQRTDGMFNATITDLEQEPVQGAVRVENAGAGCWLTHRRVLERLAPTRPKYRENAETLTNFFGEFVEGERYFTEDYAICTRWTDTGGLIWALLDTEIAHAGQLGNFSNLWNDRVALGCARDQLRRDYEALQAAHSQLHAAVAHARLRGLSVEVEVEALPAEALVWAREFQVTDCASASTKARGCLAEAREVTAKIDSIRAAEAAE